MSALSPQLPLALRYPPDQRFDTFVAAEEGLLEPLRDLARAPQRTCVFVAGASGTGKTHLLLATCAEAEARGLDAAYLRLASAAGRLDEAFESLHARSLVALDGLEHVAGHAGDERALFEFHNRMQDHGRALLYAARALPDALPVALPDLRSRWQQGIRVGLPALDDAGRREVLRLRARRRGLQVDDAAIDWLLRRVGRDMASLTALFERLDRVALAEQRGITVPFLRKALGEGVAL